MVVTRSSKFQSRMTACVTLAVWGMFALLSVVGIVAVLAYELFKASPASDGLCIGMGCSREASGRKGAVASDHQTCSLLARNIMKIREGNAMDAAVTTAICIGVMVPWSSGIGGGGIMVYRDGSSGKFQTYDSRETAPAAATESMFDHDISLAQRGGLAIGVPGEIKGLYEAHQEHGKLPWRDLFDEVIRLAENQIVSDLLATILKNFDQDLIDRMDEFKKLFKPDGVLLKAGDVLRMPKLAETLRKIQADPESFYNGDLANDIADDIQAASGIVTTQDLTDYQVKKEDRALCTWYAGHQVCGAHPEISGGASIGLALNILEPFNLQFQSDKFHKTTIEAMKFAFGHRNFLGDPEFQNVTELTNLMMDKTYASTIRSKLKEHTVSETVFYTPPDQGAVASPGNHGTTHFSIIDTDGNVVSMTSTINLYFGSMVVGKKTGIIFNDEMDDFSNKNSPNAFGLPPSPTNYVKAGKRPLSSMAPTIVLKNGKVRMVVGAAGGPKIITATLQTILNVLSHGMSLKEAVESPRFHHQLVPKKLMTEKQWSSEKKQLFENHGHELSEVDFEKHQYLGVVEAIEVVEDRDGNSDIIAVTDWRKPVAGPSAF